jgi:hypothetical protein
MKLLNENKFSIDAQYWHKAFNLTIRSCFNSFYQRQENKKYGSTLRQTSLDQSPIFIVGHWRSGTTLLHNLMCQDPQLCFLNLFQAYNPHTFLHLEPIITPRMAGSRTEKRPMDNMEVRFDSPAEDEFALAILSLRSPLLSWSFPRREQYYDQDLTFQNVPRQRIEQWKNSLLLLCKKITLKNQRRIIFKSPAHTARIKLLLEMFPEALFIHIHRNPYSVFLSTRKLYDTALPGLYLQQPKLDQINEGILRRYRLMYDAFLEQVNLIPKENYVEICFEDFENDLIGTIKNIYKNLNLPGFEAARPGLQNHVTSIKHYQKNVHPELQGTLKEQIAAQWRRYFDQWNYQI